MEVVNSISDVTSLSFYGAIFFYEILQPSRVYIKSENFIDLIFKPATQVPLLTHCLDILLQ